MAVLGLVSILWMTTCPYLSFILVTFFPIVDRFDRPILHGLCILGYAVRAIIKSICKGDPTMVKGIFGRFLLHVFPGETAVTEMWLEGLRVIYQTSVKERNRAVLSGYVDLHCLAPSL
ncbi:hypothetical protein SLEP1_g59890 [Rubroshorea leprosula]|uniref:MaoC-like domain-containing protein n=1 Tax=Rubroshorea leprosula TaxID=152421 RepID=A0AAV5MY87_9ROSI|nr:hypothetical protein SLEP1_g59890 [Rubroshorea leprosula]